MSRSKVELLNDWLGLLRSGQYEQTRERLKDDTGYCCLGVAADGLFDVEWSLAEESKDTWYEYRVGNDEGAEWACDNELIAMHTEALGLDKAIDRLEKQVLNGIVYNITDDWDEDAQVALAGSLEAKKTESSREYYLISLNDGGLSFEEIATFIEMSGWIESTRQEEADKEVSLAF